jgi:histidyl-tRNA synthetase
MSDLPRAEANANSAEVFVATIGPNMQDKRTSVVSALTANGFRVATPSTSPKFLAQLMQCESQRVQWIVIVADELLQQNVVRVKNVFDHRDRGVNVSLNELPARLSTLMQTPRKQRILLVGLTATRDVSTFQ